MKTLRRMWKRLATSFAPRHGRSDADLAAEFEAHIALLTEKNISRGMSSAEARRAALIKFGALEPAKENYRDQRALPFIDSFHQDLRYSFRMLRKAPGFTAVALLTLALGIGANTAIFGLADAVLFRSLPVKDAGTLVVPQWTAQHYPQVDYTDFYSHSCAGDETRKYGCSLSLPIFQELASRTDIFSDIAAMAGQQRLLATGATTSEAINAEFVTGNYFQLLGVHALEGRTLEARDDAPAAQAVGVLSYQFWRDALSGNPAIIGSSIVLSNSQARIVVDVVGVVSSQFPSLEPGTHRDIWLPVALQKDFGHDRLRNATDGPDEWWLYSVARLRTDVPREYVRNVADGVFQEALSHSRHPLFSSSDSPRLKLQPVQSAVVGARGDFAKPLTVLMLASSLILLIACANLSGLMLARTAARKKEFALRSALGASRQRLARQLFTESVLIACVGSTFGALLARWTSVALSTLVTRGIFQPVLDVGTLGYSIGITLVVVTALMLGAASSAPQLRIAPSLATQYPRAIPQRRWSARFGDSLVVLQLTLSVVLLTGAGLLVRTLKDLRSIDPGFDTSNLLLVSLDPGVVSPSDQQLRAAYAELYRRFRAMPGVVAVSYSASALLSDSFWRSSFRIEDSAGGRRGISEMLAVGPSFFETMRIPIVAGRALSESDFRDVLSVQPVVVNEAFVREFSGGQNPIGVRLSGIGRGCGATCEIVGVVADTKYSELRVPVRAITYVPQINGPARFAIRAAVNMDVLIPAVRREVVSANSLVTIRGIRTQREQINLSLQQERMMARLSGLFGTLALVLVCVGVYGLFSYESSRRTREIGIRKALGARTWDVIAMVMGRSLLSALVGVGIGTAASLAAMRFLDSFLYGVTPSDPVTFVASIVLLLFVALIASYLPARRATRVDPVVALRSE